MTRHGWRLLCGVGAVLVAALVIGLATLGAPTPNLGSTVHLDSPAPTQAPTSGATDSPDRAPAAQTPREPSPTSSVVSPAQPRPSLVPTLSDDDDDDDDGDDEADDDAGDDDAGDD